MQVRDVPAGEKVGYTGSFTTQRPSRIAVFGAGYGDGYPRALSSLPEGGPARVFIAGQFAPIAGRISMDMITVDVTDIPAEKLTRGTIAELLGKHVTLDEMARLAGTIPYEILTRLGTRYARIYSGFESPAAGATAA
jgi:alanine racemase